MLSWHEGGSQSVDILRDGQDFPFLCCSCDSAGPEKAQALPMFYALMGRVTVSSFAGHHKRTAWAVWTTLLQLTQTFTDLATAPDHIDKDAMNTIKTIVILLCKRTSTPTYITWHAANHLQRRKNVQLTPSTSATLKQHVRRGRTWLVSGSGSCADITITNWLWLDLIQCKELVSNKCHKICIKKCKSKNASQEWKPLCTCEEECSQNKTHKIHKLKMKIVNCSWQ